MFGFNGYALDVPDLTPTPTLNSPENPRTMTVYQIHTPNVQQTRGRLKMLWVLACCAAPVLASYITYFVIKPQGRTHYAELIHPPVPMPPAMTLKTLSGEVVPVHSLQGQWIIAIVAHGACDAVCENNLLIQRQLREALGKEKDRVDKIWFVTDETIPSKAILQSILSGEPTQVLQVSRAELSQWLKPAGATMLEHHLFVIDPHAQWMMRTPPQATPSPDWASLSRFKKDIERLLRASASWDRPGH